jgi:hypothetical protein
MKNILPSVSAARKHHRCYLRDRLAAFPELTGSRLHREIRELGHSGGYTAVKDFLREVRPRQSTGFE